MTGEIDVYGLFVPALFIYLTIAFVLQVAVGRLLIRSGMHHHIWHPPLFNFALFVIFLGGTVTAAQWFAS